MGGGSGSDRSPRGGIHYARTDESYFERRGLRRFAGVWSLWALGVGAELSPALPQTGGAYSFGRTAMGPWGGFVTGLAESIEYVLTPAVIVVGIGGYMGTIAEDTLGLVLPAPVWWALFYAVFVGVNIAGVALTFRLTVFVTLLALGVLMVFWVGALPHFRWEHALDVAPDPGASVWFPKGFSGVTASLPFAIWFYLAIEQLPLAAEESHDPKRDMPRGLSWGIATLIVASLRARRRSAPHRSRSPSASGPSSVRAWAPRCWPWPRWRA